MTNKDIKKENIDSVIADIQKRMLICVEKYNYTAYGSDHLACFGYVIKSINHHLGTDYAYEIEEIKKYYSKPALKK